MTDEPRAAVERSADGGLGLRQKARGGAAWLGARQVLNNVLRIVSVAIVARELGPTQFGLAALALSASRFLLLFNEGGMGTYLVRFEGDERSLQREARSVFWLNQVVTLVQLSVLLAGIPIASHFLKSQELAAPLLVIGFTFFIRQMSVVPEALARRRFEYRPLVLRDVITNVLTSVLSVVLALRGAGVYAILVPQLVAEPIRLGLLLAMTGFRPGWDLLRGRWRTIMAFAKHLIGSELLYLVLNDSDTLIIGATLGAEATGIYNLAWQLASLVGRNIVSIVNDVSLPTFVAARKRGDLSVVFEKTLTVLGVLTLPVQLLLAACAPLVVEVLYGPEFAGAGPVLSVLAVFMAVRAVTAGSGPIFNVLGTPKTGLLLSLFTAPAFILAALLGSRRDVLAVALAISVVRIVGGICGLLLTFKKLDAAPRTMLPGLLRAVPGAIAGAATALVVAHQITALTNPVLELGIAGLSGLIVALAGQRLVNRRGVTEARLTILGR